MIAAIYARKSTDQNLPDIEKSVTRQVERATAYAKRKGWTVDPAHVYQDDGISGAEFVKRPGFLRLMNALKPRPPFQVLIMSEESRLGREQIETAWEQLGHATIKQTVDTYGYVQPERHEGAAEGLDRYYEPECRASRHATFCHQVPPGATKRTERRMNGFPVGC